MRAKRICKDEQFRLIMECRRSGLSDYQWCEANGILPGTFYMWVTRLKKAGYTIPDATAGQTGSAVLHEVVKLPIVDSVTADGTVVKQNTNFTTEASQAAIEILLGDTTVRIYNGADPAVIQGVLQSMGGAAHAW